MKYLLLFGPPGAGKGTQATAMVKKFNLRHISTGELLRAEIAAGTALGRQADVLISQGNLVPDELVEDILAARLRNESGIAGFLLDGFPRNIKQAKDLDAILKKENACIDAVISLMIPDSMIASRIAHRAAIEGRADDAQEATIKNRIRTYHEQTEPLVEYYRQAGCYHEIDGTASVEEVAKSIESVMKNL